MNVLLYLICFAKEWLSKSRIPCSCFKCVEGSSAVSLLVCRYASRISWKCSCAYNIAGDPVL